MAADRGEINLPRRRKANTIDDGVTEPILIRGEPPKPTGSPGGPPRAPIPWRRHRDLAKQFPPVRDPATGELSGGWVLCAEQGQKGHGPKERTRLIQRDHNRLKSWLEREFPLERWQISKTMKPTDDYVRQLYFRYLGTLTPEEDRADRERRRAVWVKIMERHKELEAARELERRAARRLQM